MYAIYNINNLAKFKLGGKMPKVIFFFAGTGDDGEGYKLMKEGGYGLGNKSDPFQDDVIRIYIKGCQEKRVGNGFLFPDLEIAANNVRNAFTNEGLDLDKLKENFGDGLFEICGQPPGSSTVTVASIALEGFSRGAVTTFATAKKLNDLNIPMHIIANQPVPGETGIAKGLYSRYCDLRACHNIQTAHTFLASYNLEQGFIHNYFFRQMVAKFPAEIHAQEILVPHQHHLDWFQSSPIHHHINKLMAENGFTHPRDDKQAIKRWYRDNHRDNQGSYFTPYELMQTVYGSDGTFAKDPIYLDWVIAKARSVLPQDIPPVIQAELNAEQACAIIAISKLSDTNIASEKQRALYQLVLKDSKPAEQFVKIVNKVAEVCDYLPRVAGGNNSSKSDLIRTHAQNYKNSVILASFELLSKANPSVEDKNNFANTICEAECVFKKQALGNVIHTILKVLANFITHVTGIALIANTINKATTGRWILFKHNSAEDAVRATRKALLKDVEHLESDKDIAHAPPLSNP